MKDNEGFLELQRTEEVLLEEGKAQISIEPAASFSEEKEIAELSDDDELFKVGVCCFQTNLIYFHVSLMHAHNYFCWRAIDSS